MRPFLLPLLLTASLLPAQTPVKPASKPASAKAAPAKAAPAKAAPAKPAAKLSPEAETARQTLRETLDAIDAGWFGQPYQGVTSVEMQGTLGIALSGAAINQKVDTLSEGAVKGNSQGGQANLRVKARDLPPEVGLDEP